ncbi:MAG: T9SS type A sorting domain-containing protein [Saprospiraceae bacterium]|nr:T9SS type A sorting domain-containing protein [Saprospiraceae bacterium]
MRHHILTITLTFLSFNLLAQLPDFTESPDFNFFDINGKQIHLYSYLNQGKVVILNFSPAWCQDCWLYHRTNALQDFYTIYGPGGTDEVRVVHIETDETLGMADLQGITSASAGNWIDATPYPIIDTSAANAEFKADLLPTIYGVYPNGFIAHLGTPSSDELFDFLDAYPGSTTIPDTMIKVTIDTIKRPSCADFSNGEIALSVDGPAINYDFIWNNGDTTPVISGLLAGVYRCTITDNLENRHIIDPIELVDPDTLTLTFLKNTPISMTSNDGSIIANVSGGTPNYNYIWNTGGMSDRIENLGPGTYSVQVTDGNGCQISGSVDLDVPDCSLLVLYSVEDAACDENPDGEVTVEVAGATPPVSFNWSNGATTQSLVDVPSGGYELTVTDALGCSRTVGLEVGLNDDTRPIARVKTGPIEIYLNENGIVELFAEQVDSGSFDNCGILDIQLAQEVFDCQDIGRNFVEFTVIDNNLNLTSRDVEIVVMDTIKPYVLCTENVTVAACDGIVNYAVPQFIDNCAEGSVTIFDGIGSGGVFPLGTSEESYTYVSPDGTRLECNVSVTVEERIDAELEVSDVTCPGDDNGSATVVVGSSDPYTYRWSDGQTTASAVNLSSGTYSVTVSKTNECTFIKDFIIGEPTELVIRLDSIKAPDAQSDIYVTILGGTAPYRYVWRNAQNSIVSTSQDPKNLVYGTYVLEVTDANNCTVSSSIRADEVTPTVELNLLRDVQIWPNPVSDVFYLELQRAINQEADIEINNITGNRVYTQKERISGVIEIKTHQLDPGFYWVRIRVQDEIVSKPLVVI